MPENVSPKPSGARGSPRKRQAILTGALTVFAKEGYGHASIDAISAEANVSTRTIYNHFPSKAALFEAVIQQSTREVAATQVAIIERHLAEVTDLEADLIGLGEALATPLTEYAEHFAVVRQMQAECAHIPRAAIEMWQEAGPFRVQAELARRMRWLDKDGLLRVADPERAAVHFMVLVRGAVPFHHGVGATSSSEVSEVVAAGVHAFLYGYRA